MSLMAGAGKAELIIPEAYLAVENFGQIHDPLHVRAVILQQEEKYVIVSFELTSLMGGEIALFKKVVSEAAGVEEDHIWICTTHSFSSPHLMPDHQLGTPEKIALRDSYRNNLMQATAEAAKRASENLQPAVLKIGTGSCDIAANRDVELADGWWVGTCGDGGTDRTVTVFSLAGASGEPIASIAHYAMQSSVMDQAAGADGKKIVTSDIAGLASAKAEEVLGGVVLYLIGAAGDQSPVEKAVTDTFENGERIRTDLHEAGFEICERLSGKLADVIAETVNNAAETDSQKLTHVKKTILVPAQKMKGNVFTLVPTRNYEFESDGEREMEIEALQIGDAALVGVKPELNFVTAQTIRSQSEFAHTLVCTMVNGAAKYMADQTSFDRFCYESMNSPWDRGAAEHLAEESIQMLKEL